MKLFTRLFVNDSPKDQARQSQRAREGQSIMDLVADDAKALEKAGAFAILLEMEGFEVLQANDGSQGLVWNPSDL